MFPLGLALAPGSLLPLFLFEERYIRMYHDIVAGDLEFGVVLIERGIESRDDNPTFGVGTVAQLVGAGRHEDGTMSIVAVGTDRFRVAGWLESDPYPRATVEILEDDKLSELGEMDLLRARAKLPRLLDLASAIDPTISPDVPAMSDDSVTSLYQMAQISGPQALDMQRILEAATSDSRARLVDELVDDQIELLELQLEVG